MHVRAFGETAPAIGCRDPLPAHLVHGRVRMIRAEHRQVLKGFGAPQFDLTVGLEFECSSQHPQQRNVSQSWVVEPATDVGVNAGEPRFFDRRVGHVHFAVRSALLVDRDGMAPGADVFEAIRAFERQVPKTGASTNCNFTSGCSVRVA